MANGVSNTVGQFDFLDDEQPKKTPRKTVESFVTSKAKGNYDFLDDIDTPKIKPLDQAPPEELDPVQSKLMEEFEIQEQLSIPAEEIKPLDPLDQMSKEFDSILNNIPQLISGTPESPTIGEAPEDIEFDQIDESERAKAFATLTVAEERGISPIEAQKALELKGTPGGRIVTSVIRGGAGIGSGLAGFADALGVEGADKVAKNIDDWTASIAPSDPNFVENLAGGVGSAAVFIPFGFGVGSAAKAIGTLSPKVASWFGASASAFLESATEAGAVFNETQDEDAATKSFLANTLLIGITNKFGIFSEKAKGEILKGLTNATLEGLQEAGQSLIESGVKGEDPNWDNVIESAGIGAIIGSAVPTGQKDQVGPKAQKELKEVPAITKKEAGEQVLESTKVTEEVKPGEIRIKELKEIPEAEEFITGKSYTLDGQDVTKEQLEESLDDPNVIKSALEGKINLQVKNDPKLEAKLAQKLVEAKNPKAVQQVNETLENLNSIKNKIEEKNNKLPPEDKRTAQEKVSGIISEINSAKKSLEKLQETKKFKELQALEPVRQEIERETQAQTQPERVVEQPKREARKPEKQPQRVVRGKEVVTPISEVKKVKRGLFNRSQADAKLNLRGGKKLSDDTMFALEENASKIDRLFEVKRERSQQKVRGQLAEMETIVRELKSQGVNIEFDKVNSRIKVDDQIILQPEQKITGKVKVEDVKIADDKRITEPTEQQTEYQSFLSNFLTGEDLEVGAGNAVLNKGINDIQTGNIFTPEANIVRSAAIELEDQINKKGFIEVQGQRIEDEDVIASFEEERAERQAIQAEDDVISEKDTAFDIFTGEDVSTDVPLTEKKFLISDKRLDEAEKNIAKNLGKLGAGRFTGNAKDQVAYAVGKIERGWDTLQKFVKGMFDKFGVRKGLRELWNKANEVIGFKEREVRSPLSAERVNKYRAPKAKGWNNATEMFKEVEKGSLDVAEETRRKYLRRKLVDSMSRGREFIQAAESIDNVEVSDSENFVVNAELFTGKASNTINQIDNWLTKGKNSFMNQLNKAGFTLDDFGWYTYAKHAKSRNAKIEARNGKESGSGLTNQEADQILKDFGKENIKKLEVLDKNFRTNIVNKSLKSQLDAGIISQETYNEWVKDQSYVPLKGRDDVGQNYALGKGFSVSSTGIKKAQGRQSLPNNPFLQAIEDYENAAVRSEKNKVGQSLIDFIISNPNKDFYNITKPKFTTISNSTGEQTIEVEDPKSKAEGDKLFRVWSKGKPVDISLEDRGLRDGMKKLGMQQGVRFLQGINDFRRSFITVRNPSFILPNFVRDLSLGLAGVTSEQGVKEALKVLKNTPLAIQGVWKEIRDGKSNKWSEEFKQFEADGAKTGWFKHQSLEERKRLFEKKLNKLRKKGDTGRGWLKAVDDFIQDINEAVENGVRLSAYNAVKESGGSRQKAASTAKNLTVNFNRKGDWGGVLNSLYLFSNASIQGSYRVFQLLKTPTGKKIAAGYFASGILVNLINSLIDPEEWEKVGQFEKDTNWIFMLGGGDKVKIPLPYGFNIFPAMGSALFDLFTGQDDGTEFTSRMFNVAESAVNPLGSSGSLLQAITPTAFDPIVELSENKKFHGGPIRKMGYNPSKKTPDSELYFNSVNPELKSMTKYLNRLSGGNQKRSGWIDINPENVEHIIETITGGTGKFVMNSLETTKNIFDPKEQINMNRLPVIRRFVGEKGETDNMRIVYEMLKEGSNKFLDTKDKNKFILSLAKAVKEQELPIQRAISLRRQFNKSQAGNFETETLILDIKDLVEELKAANNDGNKDQAKEIMQEIKDLRDQLIQARRK